LATEIENDAALLDAKNMIYLRVGGGVMGWINRKCCVCQSHDGSMVLLYMVLHGSHQYTPVMLAYIPAPWILWEWKLSVFF
jgi:hypothetical protein